MCTFPSLEPKYVFSFIALCAIAILVSSLFCMAKSGEINHPFSRNFNNKFQADVIKGKNYHMGHIGRGPSLASSFNEMDEHDNPRDSRVVQNIPVLNELCDWPISSFFSDHGTHPPAFTIPSRNCFLPRE